mgnify:FL=1
MSRFRIKEYKNQFTVQKEFFNKFLQKGLFISKTILEPYWGLCDDKGFNGKYAKILPDFSTFLEAQEAIDKIIKYEEECNKKPIYHEYPLNFNGYSESLYNEYS